MAWVAEQWHFERLSFVFFSSPSSFFSSSSSFSPSSSSSPSFSKSAVR
jgi:hypothetical protein